MYSTYPQGMNGKYVHGDYDLFGIVDADEPTRVRRVEETLAGQPHSRGPSTQSVQFSVNAISRLALVKHGEQELFADFDDEALDVFYLDGRLRTLPDAAAAREFYPTELRGRQVFLEAGIPAGGLWLIPQPAGSPLAVAIAEIIDRLPKS